jgi:hypothetical protein
MVPVLRRVDPLMPWRGLGIITIATKK